MIDVGRPFQGRLGEAKSLAPHTSLFPYDTLFNVPRATPPGFSVECTLK